MNSVPYWFYSFILSEATMQLPVFIISFIGLCKDKKKVYVVILIYAVVGFITTFACEAELAYNM
ncbi:hypothetical protein V1512DRAFT_260341, partial [Lipomyces arxii]|uniref:uncharacterized protein n=1 Tax=Lipomyces arxii TaxID=56418 RepID=UPI0034CEF45A